MLPSATAATYITTQETTTASVAAANDASPAEPVYAAVTAETTTAIQLPVPRQPLKAPIVTVPPSITSRLNTVKV